MCLSEITDRNPESEGEGYVVLYSRYKKLYGLFYGGRKTTGRWLNEKDFRGGSAFPGCSGGNYIYFYKPYGCGEKKYLKGFHIVKNVKDASEYKGFFSWESYSRVIRKVKYRKAIVEGNQYGVDGPVIVAKKMYIYPGNVK